MELLASTSLTNQASQISHYFSTLNWDAIVKNLGDRILSILLAFVIFGAILWVGKLIIDAAFHQTRRIQVLGGTHRAATFHALTLNIFRYTCYFFLLYALLSLIGVPVGTLLAGAGIFSIALGLGAQGFVSDVVNGFLSSWNNRLTLATWFKLAPPREPWPPLGYGPPRFSPQTGL